ncbi:Rieske (2Fe-2S) protein [Wenzhouxiangella sp. EGI_FJ10305]|uniref:Rieske (2Fe-2S) protein n=1 Tax=Wenzhouxiangella sp. EGI_FJ10305 TaxID=3243768 RepID=UPI0035DDE476
MNEAVFLCAGDELAEGCYREFRIDYDGEPLWLIATRRNGQPRVWINLCPHQARPLNFAPDRFLTDDDNRLVCAHHGAVFDPDSGTCVAGPCRNAELRALDVCQREDRVFVQPPA